MRYRFMMRGDKLLLATLLCFFYAYSSPVRVAIRSALEGREFGWSYFSGLKQDAGVALVSGQGLYGDAAYILTGAFVAVWLLCAGFRKPDRFFLAALAGWTSIGAGIGSWVTLGSAQTLTSSKETLGLSNMSVFWTDVLPAILVWLLSIWLTATRWHRSAVVEPAAWTALNRSLFLGGAAALAGSAILLNIGPQHGAADFNGIGAMYLGLILFLLGLAPWERKQVQPAPALSPG